MLALYTIENSPKFELIIKNSLLKTLNFYTSFYLDRLPSVCSNAFNSSVGTSSLKFLESIEPIKLVDLGCVRACGVLGLWGMTEEEGVMG